jgi:SpoVK/Ycf46/Vps4 family AAA+-type ATPase
LLRAGRFDRQVLVDRPDRKGRLEILNVHIRRTRGRAAAASLPPHAGIVGVRARARLLLARPQCLARSPRIGAAGRRTNRPYSEDIGFVLTIISTATSVATHASSRGAP